MKLRYGSYTHAINEAAVQISRTAKHNNNGIPISVLERWTIDGMLLADTPAALSTAISSLVSNYASDGFDLLLLFDDSSASSHALLTGNCWGGTRVVQRPSFPEGKGAEYTLFRRYRIVVEGEILDSAGAGTVVEWDETLSFTGGGPSFGFLQTVNGAPQKQFKFEATPYQATQSGRAVGRDGWPTPAAPLFASSHKVDTDVINYANPQRMGRGSSATYKLYPVNWSYKFEAVAALVGTPTLWPSGS